MMRFEARSLPALRCCRRYRGRTLLKIQPELGRQVEVAAKSQGRIGADPPLAENNVVGARHRHVKLLRQAIGSDTKRIEELFLEDLPGMNRGIRRHSDS